MIISRNSYMRALLSASLCLGSTLTQADVAVVVNKSVPASSISSEVATSIFLSKVNTLPDGTKIIPIDQQESEKTRTDFYTKVVKKDAAQLNAYWSRLIFTGKAQPPKKVADDTEVLALVASNPELIGYVNASSVTSAVKVLLVVP